MGAGEEGWAGEEGGHAGTLEAARKWPQVRQLSPQPAHAPSLAPSLSLCSWGPCAFMEVLWQTGDVWPEEPVEPQQKAEGCGPPQRTVVNVLRPMPAGTLVGDSGPWCSPGSDPGTPRLRSPLSAPLSVPATTVSHERTPGVQEAREALSCGTAVNTKHQ